MSAQSVQYSRNGLRIIFTWVRISLLLWWLFQWWKDLVFSLWKIFSSKFYVKKKSRSFKIYPFILFPPSKASLIPHIYIKDYQSNNKHHCFLSLQQYTRTEIVPHRNLFCIYKCRVFCRKFILRLVSPMFFSSVKLCFSYRGNRTVRWLY